MKKIVITLAVLGCALGATAQQVPTLLKQNTLKKSLIAPNGLPRTFSFLKPDSITQKNILFIPTDSVRVKPLKRINIIANANVDNMPIARMQGNSKMPVIQTDRTGYNMPVMGNQADAQNKVKVEKAPAMPFLNGEAPIYYDVKPYPNIAPPANKW